MPYCCLWPALLHSIFPQWLINGTIIQCDSFGTRPKKMRISQRLFIRFCTCIYDYMPCFMISMSILLCRSLTGWVRHFLPRDFEYCSLSGNLQRNCGFNLMTTSSETAIFNRMEPHATPRMRAWPKSKAFFWWPDYIKSLMAAKISWLKSARIFSCGVL